MRRVFVPRFKGAIEGYVVNYLKKNYWRVKDVIEYEDLMQEARVIFFMLKNRYRYVDSDKWFMALFKTTFLNYFNGVSNHRTERYAVEIVMKEKTDVESLAASEYNQGYLVCLMEQAPEEVKDVLTLLMYAPTELLDEISKAWKNQGRRKLEGSSHLNKLLGYESKTDLIELVRDYFLNN